MKPQVLEEKPITSFEVKEILEKNKKEQGELSFRAQKTLEHLETTVSFKKNQVDELKGEIEKLKIPRLRESQIAKLIDLKPTTVEQVKSALQAYVLTVKPDDMKKIADAFKTAVEAK